MIAPEKLTGKAEKVIFCWSGGKDSAFAFHELKKSKGREVVALLTTLSGDYLRTSMHGVREALLDRQARSIGVKLEKVFIPKNAPAGEYDSRMSAVLEKYKSCGVSAAVFGDIFLENLREYREKNMAKLNMKAVFPIWKKDTRLIAEEFVEAGFRAVVTCVDTGRLDKKFCGRLFDGQFLADLPRDADPCGENGEFHTFVYDGPIFSETVRFKKGRSVLRDNRFYYTDLLLDGPDNI